LGGLLPLSPLELFDEFDAGVFVTNAQGDVLAVNQTAAAMLGYAREELVGKNVAAFAHPEDLAGAAPGEVEPGRRFKARRRLLHKDGRYRVAEERGKTLDDGSVVTMVTDVTAEHGLQESAEQLRFIANAVPALIAFVDCDARYVWANESYRRWYGFDPAQMRGRHGREVLGAEAFEAIRPHFERVVAGEEVKFERRLVYDVGPPRTVRAEYVPRRDADGRVVGFASLVNDITEIRAAETALRRSEHMLEHSQSAANVGSWERDLSSDAEPLRWSNENYRIFGYEPGAVEPTREFFYAAVHPEDRERMREARRAGLEGGEPFDTEFRIVRPDGTVRTIHSWTRFEHDAEGRPVRVLGTCQDITQRKQLEQELMSALEELMRADRRKDEFLAMLAHELRNPLAPILNAVEILDRTGPEDEARTFEYRAVIVRQVQHMKRLLDDLLDVSRVSQGKIQLRREPLELGAVLLQAVEVSRPIISEKRQELSLRLAPERLPLDADPTRLVQVFANLLNNAAKYTDAGGHIGLTVTTEDGEAVVCVRDDGMGMSQELLVRAFDLFVQETRSLDRAQGGLGIGLTMVRTLVRMHGGSVRAFSDGPGHGSEFVVRLPLAQRAAAPFDSVVAPTKAPAGPPLRVLVVDDNVDAAGAIGVLLELLGHEVTVAHDGPAALAAAAAAPPELVLLDIGLPGMDGYTLAARLRDAGHDRATLVALSGYGQDEHFRRSTEAGFDRHLVKPLDFDVLGEITAQLRRPLAERRGKP
jgi:PAS domain S-box-containing protein